MTKFSCLALTAVLLVAFGSSIAKGTEAEKETPANTASDVTLETIPTTTALALPAMGAYDKHGALIGQLMMYAGRKQLIRGAPFGVYHNNPEEVPEDSLRWEICVPVPSGTKAEAPYELREFPETQAAVVVCTGPNEGVDACFSVLHEWIAKNGYTLTGSAQEHWLSDPQTTAPEKFQTRILLPVVKR